MMGPGQNGDPIEGPPLIPQKHSAAMFEGFQGCPCHWAPMMPRDASLSDSCASDRCSFSSWFACGKLDVFGSWKLSHRFLCMHCALRDGLII